MKKLLLILLCLPIIGFGQWIQIGQDIDGEASNDRSGFAVALSGNGSIMAIGALAADDINGVSTGHVRVYQDFNGVWLQIGQDIDGDLQGDGSGSSVSLSNDGSILAIGAPYVSDTFGNAGRVRVFEYIVDTWIQIGFDINGDSAEDQSGRSVSLNYSGSLLAVGAPGAAGQSKNGKVKIFENTGANWVQVGQDIDGESVEDQSGYSVSISGEGEIVAIGATKNDGSALDAGHVRVYEYIGNSWSQLGQDIDGEAAEDDFGRSVSINDNGNILAVGASSNDGSGSNAGHARVYEKISGSWVQIGQDIDGEATNDFFGKSVCLNSSGNILAVGGYMNDGGNQTTANKGHVRVFNNLGGSWFQIGQDIDGEAANNYSGASIDMNNSGTKIVIGAPFNADNGISSGHARVYENTAVPSTVININNHHYSNLLRVVDMLSRDSDVKNNQLFFYIYDDGTVEKRIVIE